VGIATGVISGRSSPATAERARQCKMKYVYQGHTEKIPIINEILADARPRTRAKWPTSGTDFTDVVVMRRVGLAVATGNARPEVKAIAHFVTGAPGGPGGRSGSGGVAAEGAKPLAADPEALRSFIADKTS